MPDSYPIERGPIGRLAAQFALPEPLAHLRQNARWVGWKWTQRPDGSWDKPPFRADFPEFHASTTNPKSWAMLDTAERALAAGQIDGIGYVIREDQEHVFLDLDDCRDPATGEIADWAAELVEECDSYTELTPSGGGLRIIGTHGGFLNAPIDASYRLPCGGHGEVYFRGVRYVTMTGQHLAGTPNETRDISGPALDLLARAGRKLQPKPEARAMTPEQALAPMPDVLAALATIRNDDAEYDHWIRVGLATFAASAGEAAGLEAWMRWSAKSAKHHDHECMRAWASFHKSPPRSIGFGSLAYLARSANPLWVAPSWQGTPVADEPQGGPSISVSFDPETGEILDPPKPKAQSGRALRLLTMDEVEGLPPVPWLIHGIVPARAMVVPYGPPKAGKTFLVLSWALHVAGGLEWCGHAVTQGHVVYIVGEGLGGFATRLMVMREAYGIPPSAPLYIIPRAVNFNAPGEVAAMCQLIRQRLGSVQPVLIIIDTLARAMPGVDENSAKELGEIVARCDEIKDEFGATVMPIHHTGKDVERGLRGSNSLLGAVDASYLIQKAGKGAARLINDAMKDAEEFAPMVFDMVPHMVGLRSSIVPRLRAGPGRPAAEDKPDTDEMRMRVLLAMREADLDMMRFADVARALNVPRGRAEEELRQAIPLGMEYAARVADFFVWKSAQGTARNAPLMIHRRPANGQ